MLTTLLAADLRSAGKDFFTPLLTTLHWAKVGIAVVASVDYFVQGWRQFVNRGL